jgi:Domain of unknown function (DUF4214)
MSNSIRNFFNDAGDALGDAADDVDREVRDIAGDVEREVDDVINDIDDDDGTDAPSTTSREAQVTRLYDTMFDRRPDDAGFTFWTNALRTGVVDLEDMAELFVRSPEFRDSYGDLDSGEYVDLLYRNVLDREADPEGRAYWTEGLRSGRLDRDDVALAFSESPEHVAKIGPVNDDPLL